MNILNKPILIPIQINHVNPSWDLRFHHRWEYCPRQWGAPWYDGWHQLIQDGGHSGWTRGGSAGQACDLYIENCLMSAFPRWRPFNVNTCRECNLEGDLNTDIYLRPADPRWRPYSVDTCTERRSGVRPINRHLSDASWSKMATTQNQHEQYFGVPRI